MYSGTAVEKVGGERSERVKAERRRRSEEKGGGTATECSN